MRILVLLFLVVFCFNLSPVIAQDFNNPLPKSLTDAERKLIKNDFDSYLRTKYENYDRIIDPKKPAGKIFTPAEFDKSEGICFSWSGYSSLLTPLIVESTQDAKVFLGVSSYNADSTKKSLISAGAKAENLVLIQTRLDSVWMRDFGPYFINTEDGEREIIDCQYNRPRPNDDKFPTTLGNQIDVNVHPCRLIMPGGNFISDGHGVALMTDVVFDPSEGGDPNMSVAQLEKYMKDYFGMKKVIIIKDMHRDGTGHIDMFCKLLDDRNMIVGEYANASDGASGNYAILNENAKILANETNGLGQKFIVTRIPMPKYTGTSYTHTNSTILNNKVLVPIYKRGTDKAALDVYQKILPNHKIIGFDCNRIIGANGAIHCITKLVMADPIKILYTKTKDQVKSGENFFVKFNIDTEKKINDEKVQLNWSNNPDGPFMKVTAERFSEKSKLYTAVLPVEDNLDAIYYFISAETEMGMFETSPNNAPNELYKIKVLKY